MSAHERKSLVAATTFHEAGAWLTQKTAPRARMKSERLNCHPSKMNNSPATLALYIEMMYDIKSKKRKKSKLIAITHMVLQLKILQVFHFQNSLEG